jgi:hypothetical protein
MRLLVCGGRGPAPANLTAVLDAFHAANCITLIIHGGAPGVDSAAGAWAQRRGIEYVLFPAEWGRYGHRAGHIRNTRMLVEGRPDAALGFPGGHGTADMLRQARAAGVLTLQIEKPL